MAAPKEILDLVEEFERDQSFYKSSQFNETELRTRFINPLIAALGWDVYHDQPGRADQHEVKEEDSVEVEGKIKNPDYSFRLFDGSLGSMKRKFFIEVKRPSINIEAGAYPAFQLRRYAWSADLPISILTDFEELSVYYCLSRPGREDKPTKSRIMYLRYDQYVEKWPEIAALFSREAVLNGSLDKFARSLPQKRGEKRVDAALLGDISKWREALAKNIALRNPELDTASLNYSVQAIIDRIMFLRICEDRGIEQYMRLKHLLEGERVYARLFELFQQADERYNSGIFHFHKEPGRDRPDIITPGLKIDDGTLREIIKQLYFPESPYAFSVLPAEILGQIYEQFLGQVIRLDEGHRALVEDKPEVKKAGGVKYTPAYIVEAIVKKTLGPSLEGRTARQACEISVLDPACGSGSFLIVAYQYLLDWHRDWYVQHLLPLMESGGSPSSPEIRRLLPETEASRKGRKREAELPIYQARDGEWRLSTAERKRILLCNIYGVDIDRQAVEVTKLSLLLKVLEGENEETISKQLKLFQERALPDLGENIKCGNSLIGWDILEDNPGLGQEEIERINPFDWEREFGEVFRRGGFDVVIGNPPYVRMEELKDVKDYLRKYQAFQARADLYTYFIERETKLLRYNGMFGMIVSNKWMKARYGGPLRNFIAQNLNLHELIDFGELPVFSSVGTFPSIMVANRNRSDSGNQYLEFKYIPIHELKPEELLKQIESDGFNVREGPNHLQESWRLAQDTILTRLLTYPTGYIPLSRWLNGALIGWGIKTGLNDAFILSGDNAQKMLEADPNLAEVIKPMLIGDEIRRYSTPTQKRYLIYARRGFELDRFSLIKEHLSLKKDQLSKRATVGTHPWYELQQPQPKYAKMFEKEKIVWPEIGKEPRFTVVGPGVYLNNKCFFTDCDSRYLLGILNSRLAWELLKLMCSCLGDVNNGGRLELRQQYMARLPMPEASNNTLRDRMVALVEQMLALHKQLPQVRTPHEQTTLQRQIEATDRQIDALVYELYGLTEEEITIVEGGG